jgi:hypothetical protein
MSTIFLLLALLLGAPKHSRPTPHDAADTSSGGSGVPCIVQQGCGTGG